MTANKPSWVVATETKLSEIYENIEGGVEAFCDICAEHNGEVAAFGDSWPGAVLQLREIRDGLRREARVAAAFHRSLVRAGWAEGECWAEKAIAYLPGIRGAA